MDLLEQVTLVLDKIKPYLDRDGGGFELIKVEEGIVYIKMLGACATCLNVDSTVKEMIEVILTEEVPGITKVVAIN